MTKQDKFSEAHTLISDAISILDGEVGVGFMKNRIFEKLKELTENDFFELILIEIYDKHVRVTFNVREDVKIYGLYWITFEKNGHIFHTTDFNGGYGICKCKEYHEVTKEQMEVVEEINEKLKPFFDEVSG